MRKRAGTIAAATLVLAIVLGLAVWLGLPGSAVMLVQGFPSTRDPATFTFRFTGLPVKADAASISLLYMPQTPILGISEHYWSIIAPYRVDYVTRQQRATVANGTVQFAAPLALAGLSNFRLTSVSVALPSGHEDPIEVDATTLQDGAPPRDSLLPYAHVSDGTYTFKGPLAFWRLTGAREDPTGVSYLPTGGQPRQALWPKLRALDATIDAAPYPLPEFDAPVDWIGAGWHLEGRELVQPGASLEDGRLTVRPMAPLAFPYMPDCAVRLQLAETPANRRPGWASSSGRWSPVASAAWTAFAAAHPLRDLRVDVTKQRAPGPDGVALAMLAARGPSASRLYGACPEPRRPSLAVAWLDVRRGTRFRQQTDPL